MIRRGFLAVACACLVAVAVGSPALGATVGWVVRYPTSVVGSQVTVYVEHPATTSQHALRLSCSLSGVESFHNVTFYGNLAAATEPFTGACPGGTGVPTGRWWIRQLSPVVDHTSWGEPVIANGYEPPADPTPPPTASVVTVSGAVPMPDDQFGVFVAAFGLLIAFAVAPWVSQLVKR